MKNTKDNRYATIDAGHISELTAERALSLAGYTVLHPNRTRAYDLVVETKHGFIKVQVKTARVELRKGKTAFAAHLSKFGGREGRRPYTPEEVDYFCIVNGDDTYFMNIHDSPPRGGWRRYVFPASNIKILPAPGDRPIPKIMYRRRKNDSQI